MRAAGGSNWPVGQPMLEMPAAKLQPQASQIPRNFGTSWHSHL
jgi:hypothetical protein